MPKKVAHDLTKFMSPRELREMFRPRKAAPPEPTATLPEIPAKRWRMAIEGVRAGKTDDQIVREFNVPLEIVQLVRSECEKVKQKLSSDPPVEWNAKEPAVEGDPEYVAPPPPAPEPPAEPTPVPGDGGLN